MDDCPELEVPHWALEWLTKTRAHENLDEILKSGWSPESNNRLLRQIDAPGFRLISIRVPEAVAFDAQRFEQACHDAYLDLKKRLTEPRPWHPIRLWNFIPKILSPLGSLEHRYMVFNAGRYRAFHRWHDAGMEKVATASGVGHFGRDLMVHCLAADRAGKAVENPRQTPSYRYSKRFGPLPPCFARATRFSKKADDSSPWLLVGGTASVRGEDSIYVDDLERQLDETLRNLASVVREGFCCPAPDSCPTKALRTFQSLRVYYVDDRDLEQIASTLDQRLPASVAVEYQRADLCRPDLLVEIEGLARAELLDQALKLDIAKKEAGRLHLARQELVG